jgi:hypothetical protein
MSFIIAESVRFLFVKVVWSLTYKPTRNTIKRRSSRPSLTLSMSSLWRTRTPWIYKRKYELSYCRVIYTLTTSSFSSCLNLYEVSLKLHYFSTT